MLHVLAIVAAAMLFGTTGTSQALGPPSATPLEVGVMRLVVGGSALAALAFVLAGRRRRHHPIAASPGLGIRPLALMAFTGACLAVYQPLFFLGTDRNGVAVGTVVALGSAPILAGLGEWAFLRRVPRGGWMIATALATLGVVLLGFGGEAGGTTDVVGILGSVGAGASFAGFVVAQRRLLDAGWDPFTVVGAMGAGAGVIAIAALPFVDVSWLASGRGIVMTLWLGVATVAIAYVLFTWGLGGLTAATTATLTLAEPLTAGLLGVLVLGERLGGVSLLGLAVLAGGLSVLARSARPRDPAPLAVEG